MNPPVRHSSRVARRRRLGVALLFPLLTALSGCWTDDGNPPAPVPFDLSVDADRDGVPDELMAAVQGLERVAAGGDSPGLEDGELDAFDRELGDFIVRLPLAESTRQLQREIQALYERSNQDDVLEDPVRYAALMQEIEQKFAAMDADPGYRAVVDGLDRIADRQHPGVTGGGARLRAKAAAVGADWSRLQTGDILLERSKPAGVRALLYALYVVDYSHAGMFYGANQVYESLSGGVVIRPLEDWKESGVYVGLARSKATTIGDAGQAVQLAQRRFKNGVTPYNLYIWDKWDQRKGLYCSQLVWHVHDYLGVDVDSNDVLYRTQIMTRLGASSGGLNTIAALLMSGTIYYGVMPDEVARSPHVEVYSTGMNP